MRPTQLPPPDGVPVVTTVAVRHQDAAEGLTQQLTSHRATPRQPYHKHRYQTRHRHPQPGPLASLAPTRLIEVCHPLIFDIVTGFGHRLGEHLGRDLFGLADRAHTHRHTKEIIHHPSRGALGQAIRPRTERHGGMDAGAIGATGNPLWPGRPRRLAAGWATQLMPLILGHHRLDGRNLQDLMTKRRRIISCEAGVAAGALIRLEHHYLIDLFYRDQGARMTSVARLAATTTLTARAFGPCTLWRIA